jgi:hypothetical protein
VAEVGGGEERLGLVCGAEEGEGGAVINGDHERLGSRRGLLEEEHVRRLGGFAGRHGIQYP